MTGPSIEIPAHRSSTSTELTVLVVADRRRAERLDSAIGDEFAVRAASSLADAMATLEDADCLVCDSAALDRAPGDAVERIDRRAPRLPIVLLVDDGDESAVLDAVRSTRWVDYLDRRATDATTDRLAYRIRSLVDHRRLAARSERALAGIELAQDAIGIVAPDGDLAFANRAFAIRFGYDRDDLVGRPWQTLFTDDSADRLETTAIPTVTDGWRWSGTCTGRRNTGETVPVRVRVGGLEDGSLVFVVDTSADGGDEVT